MKKKILAGLLALCMIFSMVPMSAMAEGESSDDTPTADSTAQAIRAPLGDTKSTYTPEQLNIDRYTVAAKQATAESVEGVTITAVYDVDVTHPALLKHGNAQQSAVDGLWVGIGAKISTLGEANGQTPAGKAGNGSSYMAFVRDKTETFTQVVGYFKDKGWAGQGTPGFSEYGWRSHENGYLFQWYNLADTDKFNANKQAYLVERNPVKDQTNQYTYIVYRVNFDVIEGHLVKITAPTNGTLTVKNGEADVATNTPVGEGTELTIIPKPNFGYEIDTVKVGDTALTAGEDGTYTTTMADADVTISATFKEKVAEPKIEAIGFEWDAATADAEINAAIKEARELDSFDNVRDSDDQTFWFILSGLKNNGTYTFKVTDKKDGTVLETKVEKSVSVTEANAGKPAFYYSPLHGEFQSWKSFPTEGGTYTISVYEGESVTADSEAIVTGDFTVPAYTAPTATANLRADMKTLNVELSKAIRGNYKVELFKGDGTTAAATAIEKFFDGTSKTIAFTNEEAFAEGTYKVKVSTCNSAPVVMFTLPVDVKAPKTDGISAGFAWTAAEANKLREVAVKAAGKTVPDGGYTDSLDQTLWLLINEPVAGKHYWYEISNGGEPIWSGAWNVPSESDARGMIAVSFLHTRPGDENVQNPEDVVFDKTQLLTFKVWKSESEITAKPQGDPESGWTQTVNVTSSNDLTMLTPEAKPVENTVSVKFNRDLYGRYYIAVTDSEGEVVAEETLECDASEGPALAEGTAQVFNDVTLAAGEYTVSIYQAAYDATTKKYAGNVISEQTFTLSDTIASVQVLEGDTELTAIEAVVDATADPKTITLKGMIANPATKTVKLVAVDADGDEVGTVDELQLKYEDGAFAITEGSKLTTILGSEYEIKLDLTAVDTPIVPPATDVTIPQGVVIAPDKLDEAKDAAGSVTTTSEDTVTQLATAAAAEVDAVKADDNDHDYDTETATAKLAAGGVDTTGDGVTVSVVVQPYLDVQLKGYTNDGTTKKLELDISAKYRVVATTADISDEDAEIIIAKEGVDNANAVDITKKNAKTELEVSESINLEITLPTSFTTGIVYVKHEHKKNGAHFHRGNVDGDHKLTFTSDDGLSPFSIEDGTTVVAQIGEKYYTTLAEAVAAVEAGGTITVIGDASAENIEISKSFTITKGDGGTLPPADNIKPASGYNRPTVTGDADTSWTITAGSTTSRPGSSGGSGGSTVTTYPITAPTAPTGGKVSVSGAAAAGATVTITTTPDEGKKVDTVTVTDANGNAVAVTNAGENKYTFVMPSSAVSVSVTFVDGGDTPNPPVWENPYSDVKENDWYYNAVKYVTENKLMEGTGDGKFEPGTKLTRAMFAQILYNKAGKPAVTGTADYKDFKTGQWYSDAIVWATQNNVLEGYSDGRVGVSDKITREQLALMLWRYVGKPEAPADVTINGNVSSWAAEAMRWAVANGVINGDQNGNHNPKNTATRAEVAQILMNYYNK